jgi:Phosphatidylserine/phosphatidylglycerophosphate/cardiolipin synthases and related enzymes
MWDSRLFGQDLYYIFYLFLAYGIFGWIYESCLLSIQKKTLINRGFLTGPIIPIYGFGALFVYLTFWDVRNNFLLVFFGSLLLATLLEYITSLVMELIFHTRWWDYSTIPLNVNGRVCLPVSLFWGALALVMIHIMQPFVDSIIGIIPRQIGEIIGYLIVLIIMVDSVSSITTTVRLEKLLMKVNVLRQDITEFVGTTKIYETGEELLGKFSNLKMPGVFADVKETLETRISSVKNNKRISISELKLEIPEIELKMKEFLKRYQNIKIHKAHIRLLKAFPTMKVNKREMALSDLREKLNRKGVLELSKDIREEVTGKIKSYLSGFFRASLVGLLVILQFTLIIYLTLVLREYTLYLYTSLQILSIVIVIGLVNDNRNASYKISWICIIAAFPITGHIMFILWGNMRRKKIDQSIVNKLQRGNKFVEFDQAVMDEYSEKYPTKSRITRYLESNGFPLYKNNQVTYYPMGEDVFEAISNEMDNAHNFILINFFIVGEGVLWNQLHEKLLRKIKEGVQVLFMYDDFGAMLRTPRNFKKSLENEGFQIRVFNPIYKYTDQLYMNYRSHQKIIVIDGNVGFTGGMNLADEYVNLVQRFGTWKDNAVKVEGDAVWGLTVTFLRMWEVCGSEPPIDYNPYRPTKKFEPNDSYCQVFADGPANNPKNPAENVYKQTINYAKKILYITTPYLIIEDDMRDALVTSAISGIDVRIITPFIPDKKNVKILTNYNYGRLLAAGVRIFEYTPGFIHAKTIINEDCGIVGTINMDYRSFHLHYECGVWMCDKKTIDIIRDDLLQTMEKCHEVTYEEWKNRPFYIKFYQKILNLFSTLM